jgi:hypothetical protein
VSIIKMERSVCVFAFVFEKIGACTYPWDDEMGGGERESEQSSRVERDETDQHLFGCVPAHTHTLSRTLAPSSRMKPVTPAPTPDDGWGGPYQYGFGACWRRGRK